MTDQGDRLRLVGVLSAAAHAGRRYSWQILAVAIPVSVISAGLEIVLEHFLDPSDAALSISATLAVTGISILGTVLLSGFVCGLVGATEHGREWRTFAGSVRSLPWKRLIMADILVTLMVIIGLVLVVLPGLAALTLFAIVGPVIEIEDRQVLSAFRRSVHLVRQHVWPVILLGTVPLSLAAELEAVAPEPDRAGEIAEFLLIRGVAIGLVEACLALLLVELCYQLMDSDRRNGSIRSPQPDAQLAASRRACDARCAGVGSGCLRGLAACPQCVGQRREPVDSAARQDHEYYRDHEHGELAGRAHQAPGPGSRRIPIVAGRA